MPRIKFPYRRYPAQPDEAFPNRKNATKPVIPVNLINGSKSFPIYALVDSGAYATLLSPELCPVLGIKLEDGKESKAIGISGHEQKTYFHNIQMEVGGYIHKCYVGFTAGLSVETALLGQQCFFHHFKKVAFDYNAGEIEIVW